MTEELKTNRIERIKAKWDLQNNTEFAFVCVLFTVTGVLAYFIAGPILRALNLHTITPIQLYWLLITVTMIPFFLILLLFLNYNKKLKARWQLTSNWQFFIVLVLFSITGSSSIRVARPLMALLGLDDSTPGYIYWPLRFLIVFPIYQLLFMMFGFILRQWEFTWRFEKKMLGGFGRLFGVKPKKV